MTTAAVLSASSPRTRTAVAAASCSRAASRFRFSIALSAINELSVASDIYHFGDFDPSGVNAGEKIEEPYLNLAG